MNINWYVTFITLSKTLNYRKASEIIHITEPSIYKQIKNLETELQTKLFFTQNKKLYLTKQGEYLVPLAKAFIKQHDHLLKSVKQKANEDTCTLDIAVSPYIATYLIPQFLSVFFKKHSNININIHVVERNIEKQIKAAKFDVGISRALPVYHSLYSKQICEGSISLYVPNLEENKSLDELSLLNKYRILSGNHPYYWDTLKKEIVSYVPNATFSEIHNVSLTEKLISTDQGVSYLPDYLNTKENQNILKVPATKINQPVSFTYFYKLIENNEWINLFEAEFTSFIKREQMAII